VQATQNSFSLRIQQVFQWHYIDRNIIGHLV